MIKITELTKTYANGTKALNALTLQVPESEIFALLGPNGAGKTTLIKILTTLAGFDDGTVEVAGFNIDRDPHKVRNAIGCVNQKTGVDFFLTGRENLTLLGQLYRMSRRDIQSRITELAEYFGLTKNLDELVSAYSGGMQRKLDIATALIHRPKVLFLDEPTLGLDIQSRKNLWHLIDHLNQSLGLTILLTTHYLEEADQLAHRVAIIDTGSIKVTDSPNALKDSLHGDIVSLAFEHDLENADQYADIMTQLEPVNDHAWENQKLHLYVTQGAESIPKILSHATEHHINIKSIAFSRPSLDDVFIKLTGASLTTQAETATKPWWEKWAGKNNNHNQWQKKWTPKDTDSPSAATTQSSGTPKVQTDDQPWEQNTHSTHQQQWPNNNNDKNWKNNTD